MQLDRDRQHSDLWVWVLQQAMNARVMGTGAVTDWWDNLAHYPALLLLRGATMAAITAGHEDVIVRISQEPTWSSIFVQQGAERPAHEVLHLWSVLDDQITTHLPRWNGSTYLYPSSRLVRAQLTPIATDLAGPDGMSRLLDRMEYRMALANHLLRPGSTYYHGAAGGEYLGSWPWRNGEDDHTAYTADFLERGDQAAWGRTGDEDPEFVQRVEQLDDRLRRIRRD